MEQKPSPEDLKHLVLNSSFPLLFKNLIEDWPLLGFDLTKWSEKFSEKILPIRVGDKTHSSHQWERNCKRVNVDFNEFLEIYSKSNDKWAYFDYKYMHEWFNADINNTFNWNTFGFDSIKSRESTLWIGTAGAHTPCHYDSYSCNIISQIYGHKRWILIPPDPRCPGPMKPQRTPYEESSVYSALDFYSPRSTEDFVDINSAIVVTLEPGNVLLVPKHWWHFVENIDLAISINAWIPLESDNENRLEESLVRLFVHALSDASAISKENILNPNEDELCQEDLSQSVKYLAQSSKCFFNTDAETSKSKNYLAQSEICEKIANKFKNHCQILPPTEKSDFMDIIKQNSCRHLRRDNDLSAQNADEKMLKCLINSFCHPHVINTVKQLFIDEFRK